ncbi:hypothetical protein Tco_0607170 [Tanacetum coccineum]
MSSMSEDIQYAGSDTRPPMLDRTDFESWQQRIGLYCLGKDNGDNIMKSIDEGPFHMVTVSDVIAARTEGAVQQGPVRARVLNDLSAEEKERYKADIRATNILLQGSELTKDDRESQLYDEFEHFCQIKGETIQGYYESNFDQLYAYLKQHEVHANENRTMMERFLQPTNDPLALVSNASVQQYPTQSSKSPQSSNEPSPADDFQLDSGTSSTENLIESLSNSLALLTQSGCGSRCRGRLQYEPIRKNHFQRNNARGNVVAGILGVQNRGGINLANSDIQDSDSSRTDATNESPEMVQYWMEETVVVSGRGPTTQTMFMVNLTSEDPIYDEVGPSYDSNTPFEVQDHDTFVNHMDEYHEVHEMQSDVQHNYVVDSDADYTSDSNIIPYDQYVEDNEEHIVQSNVSSSKTEEVTILKKDFKQEEDKFLEEFLDIKRLKEKVEDRLYKQDQSVQTVHMLCKPKSFYDEKNKVAIGYKNPLCLTRAKQVQPALYNGHVLVMSTYVGSCALTQRTLDCPPPDYSKENLLTTFAPQRNLTPEQIFWSIDENDKKKAETSVPKPILALTVYPPNTPVKLVPIVLPTKSQVKINLYVLTQLFTEFDKTCKKRITPTGVTEGERGFEQTKRCYLTEVIPFFKTLKEHFVGVQTALFKEVKVMEEIFDQMNNEVDKNTVDKQCDEIVKKNLLIENENLIANCLSNQLLYDVEKSRCLDLEAEMSKVHNESKHISKLEREYLNVQLKYQHLQESFDNDKSQTSQEALDFNSFFKIKNLEHQI